MAIAVVALVAIVWLNQGSSLAAWKEGQARSGQRSTFESVRAPFLFLYRRSPDEELYFATASATFGRPRAPEAATIRGPSSLPPLDTPADGKLHVPYSEVPFEYPPPNVPFILLPALAASSFEAYAWVFCALMGGLLVVAAWLASRLAAPASARDRAARLLAFAALLLAHGALAIQRLDAIVALLLVLVVRSAVRRADQSFGFWSSLAGAAKIVPGAVGLAALVAGGALRSEDGRTKRTGDVVLGALAGIFLGLGPMLALSFDSLRVLLRYHGARGLHVESTLGVLYGAGKAIAGASERAVLDYGSFNFHGAVADALAKASPVLLLVLVGLATYVARPPPRSGPDDGTESGEARTGRIVLAALATTIALWLGGKVFSPQYLTWALPLVIAVPGRGWRALALLLGAVLLLSQVYYRGYYDHVYGQRPLGILTMVTRLVLVGTFFVVVLGRLARRGSRSGATRLPAEGSGA